MDFKKFLKGLAAAAIGGATTSAAGALYDPTILGGDLTKLGIFALSGALTTAAGYYVQSPLAPRPPRQRKPPADVR